MKTKLPTKQSLKRAAPATRTRGGSGVPSRDGSAPPGSAFPARETPASRTEQPGYSGELRRWPWKTGSFFSFPFLSPFFLKKLRVEEKEAN